MTKFQPACHTESIITYTPLYGDQLIWSGWFTTWHGFLVEFKQPDSCLFMMAGLPLFLVNQSGQGKSVKTLSLEKIRNSKAGEFAVIRHSNEHNYPIWFV